MKRLLSIIIFIMICAFGIQAQNSNKLELSLSEAMDLALKNRPDLKNNILNQQLSENELDKLNALVYPKISTNADMRYNSQLQTNVIPSSAFGGPAGDFKKVQFGTKYNTTLSFDLQQPLYDPTYKAVKQTALANIETSKLNAQQLEIDVKYQVSQNYYALFLAKVKLNAAQYNVKRNEKYLTDAKSKFENGSLLKTDLDRFNLDLLNAKISYERERNNVLLAQNNLNTVIGNSLDSEILIKDSLSLLQLTKNTSDTQLSPENRVEFKLDQNSLNIANYSIKRYQMDALPRVNLYGFYGVQALRNQFDMFSSTSNWNPYNYLGVKLSLNIFDGTVRRNNLDQAKLQALVSQNNIENRKRLILAEQKNASVSLQNTFKSLESAQVNLRLAEDLVKLNQDRFREGAITNAELINSEKTLIDTQTNYIQAVYDYLLAQLNLQKASSGL